MSPFGVGSPGSHVPSGPEDSAYPVHETQEPNSFSLSEKGQRAVTLFDGSCPSWEVEADESQKRGTGKLFTELLRATFFKCLARLDTSYLEVFTWP